MRNYPVMLGGEPSDRVSRLRCRIVLRVGVLVALTTAALGPVAHFAAAAAGPVYAVRGPECPDVMVLAVRGSGEMPQGSDLNGGWPSPNSYRDPATHFGAGKFNLGVFDRMTAARPDLRLSLDSIMYPADAVPRDLVVNPGPYLASVDTGVAVFDAEVTRVEALCKGAVKYLITGYSQGAWVVHKALWRLSANRPRLLEKILGVSLFGDPLFEPEARIVRDSPLTQLWRGSATLSDPAAVDVPKVIRSVTASYCLVQDPVCQAVGSLGLNVGALGVCTVANWTPPNCPHVNYESTGKVAAAAAFLAGRLPAELTRTVANTFGGDLAQCAPGNKWTFQLNGLGGTTGIRPPRSISVRLANGSTRTATLSKVNGDFGTFPIDDGPPNTAFYELSSPSKLTGEASAEVNVRWNPSFKFFGLMSGPCEKTSMTLSAAPSVVVLNGQVRLAGRLSLGNNRPLANKTVFISWHSARRDGKGQRLGPFTTDAEGRFSTTVIVDDAAASNFSAEYIGSGPTSLAQWRASVTTQVWSLPATVPASISGSIASSAGTTFTGKTRRTVLSGTGFLPNTDVGIAIYPGAALVATTITDSAGAFRAEITIPRGSVGDYTVLALGYAIDQDDVIVRYLSLPIRMAAQ